MQFRMTLLLAVIAALTPGCQCGRLEIGPSNLVAQGRYQGLYGFPWGDDQEYVISNKVDASGQELDDVTVLRVKDRTTCDVVIRKPHWYWSVGKSLLVFENIDWNRWTARLSEVKLPCGPVRRLFDDVYLATWRDSSDAFFYLLVNVDEKTGTGRVVKVTWPSGEAQEVRSGVSSDYFDFDWPSRRFFHREAGRVISFKLDGAEEGRFGSDVTYFVSSGSGEMLFEQKPKLFRTKTDGAELRMLSADACNPGFADRRIVYAEPCERPRQIIVRDRQSENVVGRYGTSVARFRTHPDGWLSWIEAPAGEDNGALWVKVPGAEPVRVAESASPEWHIAAEGGYVLHAVMTGPKTAQLVSYDLASATSRVLAENVDPSVAVAESPWSAHFAVVDGLALPQAADGETGDRVGTLALVHPVTGENVEVAPVVPVRGFQFSWQAPAIGYLRNYDPQHHSGDFEVLSMLDRKRYPVDREVREFAEVFAPRRGVVYIVRTEGRSGIYFVTADVALF